jgi:hypothetical protein
MYLYFPDTPRIMKYILDVVLDSCIIYRLLSE